MSSSLSPILRSQLLKPKRYNFFYPHHHNHCQTLPSSRFFSTIQKESPQHHHHHQQQHYDILIIGGGVAGSTLTKLLQSSVVAKNQQQPHPLRIGLLEFKPPPPSSIYFDKKGKDVIQPMARAYALSPQSLHLINGGGESESEGGGGGGGSIMERLKERVGTYEHMQVWESDGPATLQFHHSDLEHIVNPNITNQNILGAVVEDGPLVSTLWEDIKSNNNVNSNVQVDMISPAVVKSIKAPPVIGDGGGDTNVSAFPPPPVKVTYEQTTTTSTGDNDDTLQTQQYEVTTDLLVAADGGNSFVRRTLSMPTISFGYNRRAVTCTVQIDRSMYKTAFQRFMLNGPIALLPIWDEDNNSNDDDEKLYANIVWSTTPSEATEFQNMSNDEFIQKLNNELQKGPTNNPPLIPQSITSSMPTPLANLTYGIEMLAQSLNNGITMSQWSERKPFVVPPLITGIVGRKFGFDLNLMQAQSYVQPRVALLGDAAHTIHPMAGQGLNLGLSDADCLVRLYNDAIQSGMDFGGTMHFLNMYDQERKVEVGMVMGGIQALHGLFGTTFEPLVYVRSLGMNMVNSVGVVRKRLVEVATGASGITTKRIVKE